MPGDKGQWLLPPRPERVEDIRFFQTDPPDETSAMAETPTRGETIMDVGPTPDVSRDGALAARESETRQAPARWESPSRSAPEPRASAEYVGAPVEQLARLEDKTSRIEEKLARSEAASQRVIDRFEMASSRMDEVAMQSDLALVRDEVGRIGRRVRALPGFTALILTSVVTALLTAVIFIAILRDLPTLLGR